MQKMTDAKKDCEVIDGFHVFYTVQNSAVCCETTRLIKHSGYLYTIEEYRIYSYGVESHTSKIAEIVYYPYAKALLEHMRIVSDSPRGVYRVDMDV